MAVNGQKIGWNSHYSNNSLTYSGDITSAPNGAVEYLHCAKGTDEAWIVRNNVFSGEDTSGYKIIVGEGSDVSRKYMMDPNNLKLEVKTNAVERQTVLGLFLPEAKDVQSFVLLNFGAGQARVSYSGGTAVKALYEQYKSPFDFKLLAESLGAEIVDEPNADEGVLDFSISELTKDSFTKLFE
jgi:hypothetical protein